MTTTAIFIVSIVLAVVLFDVAIIAKKGKEESISAYVLRGSRNYPLMTLLTGVLLGHLFWSMSDFDWQSKEKIVEKCKKYLEAK